MAPTSSTKPKKRTEPTEAELKKWNDDLKAAHPGKLYMRKPQPSSSS